MHGYGITRALREAIIYRWYHSIKKTGGIKNGMP